MSALVRSDTVMDPHVRVIVRTLTKPFKTQIALIWFFSSVSSIVHIHPLSGCRSIMTFFTLKGFRISMSSFVGNKSIFSVTFKFTKLTRKLFLLMKFFFKH